MSGIVRALISEVRNDLRAINVDEWIPGKYIHQKLMETASLFLKREADDRRTFIYTNLWTPIDCLEMVEDDLIKCCGLSIPNCTKVMRSKKKLPRLFTSRYGYFIRVSSTDFSGQYKLIAPEDYPDAVNKRYKSPTTRYFWIRNNYLIIPASFIGRVTVSAFFLDKGLALKLNCDATDSCKSILDEELPIPEHLVRDVRNATTMEIAQTYRSIQPDELNNLNATERTNPSSI